MPGKQHEVWFYQKFAGSEQSLNFWMDRAEDWTRLQILDGNALKPAMGEGFKGEPTPEQVKTLYDLAGQGKLVYFALGENKPAVLGHNGVTKVDLNPEKPVEPAKPTESSSKSDKLNYGDRMMRYGYRMERYQQNMEMLSKLGEGFKEAVDNYNSSRNINAEQTELKARELTNTHVRYRERLNSDRLIDRSFATKPVADPAYFYEGGTGGNTELALGYKGFDEQFAPNSYDLPTNSKISEREAATINYAMMGAMDHVEKVFKEKLKFGEKSAKGEAGGAFNMMLTGCFGYARSAQRLELLGVIDSTFKLGKESIEQYNNNNDPQMLGKNLGDCVRNVKASCTGYSCTSLTQDTVAGVRLVERIQEIFDNHPDIRQAANLTPKEEEFIRGYSQMGKVYDNFLQGVIKMGNAVASGKTLTTDEKAEILIDAVIRKMVEKKFVDDNAAMDNDPEFKQLKDEATRRDMQDAVDLKKWEAEHPGASNAEREEYTTQNDIGVHSTVLSGADLDHDIISALAKDGMLEKLRNELKQNPDIHAAASKEPMEFSVADLTKSTSLDDLAAKTQHVLEAEMVSDKAKQEWFENFKAAMTGDKPENWLNSNVPGDSKRLQVIYTDKKGEKTLIDLDGTLENGVKSLENPTKETIDTLYKYANRGELFYYDVGNDMPKRINADGAQMTAEQMRPPVQLGIIREFLYKIANILTGGRAFADILYPKPEKDPEAFEIVMAAREKRGAQNEAEQRKKDMSKETVAQTGKETERQAEKTEKVKQEKSNIDKVAEMDEKQQISGRKLAEFNPERIEGAFKNIANINEKLLPNAEKSVIKLTSEEVGVLAALAAGSKDLMIKTGENQYTPNKPEKHYTNIISSRYINGQELISRTEKAVDRVAHVEVAKALESGDMQKLGKLIAGGLQHNNKVLAGQTDLNDNFSFYAQLGGKALKIINSNAELKAEVEKHLGEKSTEMDKAKAAKNISDLRTRAMTIKADLEVKFKEYIKPKHEGERAVPVHTGNNKDIATICQLCGVHRDMKMGVLNLETTQYVNSEAVDAVNATLEKNPVLDVFRTKSDYRELALNDVERMCKLYSNAAKFTVDKEASLNQNQVQKNMNKQNENTNEQQIKQPEIKGPMNG